MSESMVERVAARVSSVMKGKFGEGMFRDDAIDIARAVIEEMRRPTEEMAIAGRQTSLYPARTFAAMIDAALSPAKVDETG